MVFITCLFTTFSVIVTRVLNGIAINVNCLWYVTGMPTSNLATTLKIMLVGLLFIYGIVVLLNAVHRMVDDHNIAVVLIVRLLQEEFLLNPIDDVKSFIDLVTGHFHLKSTNVPGVSEK